MIDFTTVLMGLAVGVAMIFAVNITAALADPDSVDTEWFVDTLACVVFTISVVM